MPITTPDLAGAFRLFGERLAEERDALTRLDQAIGDGDHGINMDRGFQAVLGSLPTFLDDGPGALCKQVGMRLISTVGGASGPLYGTFFLRMGTAMGTAEKLEPVELVAALRAGLEGVIQRGKAVPDDKTMVDAMRPAIEALEVSVGGDWQEALASAACAARQGRDRVTPLVARKGRASYLGERSTGHQDPGATSTTILFESLHDALATIS
ncbi:MAG: dihydroxyacetone kinase subunit DhaL [Candidatus Limnocylindrales bacterium]|nr:dihydroxyacetone kinase subunit L [Chloroflexota bacterium]